MIDQFNRMIGRKGSYRRRKLRKQPRRRFESAGRFSMPALEVPRTARKRRRRNHVAMRFPKTAVKRLIFSSRWISLFLLALCVGALVLVGMDESFYLTQIPVDGVASIPASEVVETSGLAGVHIFAADPVEAAAQIASIPGVISATVSLEWPNYAHIRISEDAPIAVWEQGEQKYWINAEGELVPARVDVPGLLHIRTDLQADETTSGVDRAAIVLDEAGDAEGVETALESSREETLPFVPEEVLQGALQLRELRPNIDVLYYDISGGLSYQDGRGWRVYFGTGTDMAQKLAVYETLVDHLLATQETPVYISVSNEEKPYYLASDS